MLALTNWFIRQRRSRVLTDLNKQLSEVEEVLVGDRTFLMFCGALYVMSEDAQYPAGDYEVRVGARAVTSVKDAILRTIASYEWTGEMTPEMWDRFGGGLQWWFEVREFAQCTVTRAYLWYLAASARGGTVENRGVVDFVKSQYAQVEQLCLDWDVLAPSFEDLRFREGVVPYESFKKYLTDYGEYKKSLVAGNRISFHDRVEDAWAEALGSRIMRNPDVATLSMTHRVKFIRMVGGEFVPVGGSYTSEERYVITFEGHLVLPAIHTELSEGLRAAWSTQCPTDVM